MDYYIIAFIFFKQAKKGYVLTDLESSLRHSKWKQAAQQFYRK